MTILIVDDERLARNELRRLLSAIPGIQILGEATDADQARKLVGTLKPDVLFLDVQMPGESGIDLLGSLEAPVPDTIFTTAYDEFAVKAFDLNAIDYLLKPIEPSRLALAVEKVRQKLGQRGRVPAASPVAGKLSPEDRVFVREGDNCWFVRMKEIRLLENEGSYTRVHFEGGQPRLFRSLSAMEERLDPKSFFRANRNQVINLDWVEKIEPWFSGGLLVYLKGGSKVELSRRQAQEFRERTSL